MQAVRVRGARSLTGSIAPEGLARQGDRSVRNRSMARQ